MFILKFNGVILASTTNKPTEINTANFETSTYDNRQIIALGRIVHTGDTNASIKWTISPQKKDPVTFRPIPEEITLPNNTTINAVIFTVIGAFSSHVFSSLRLLDHSN